MFSTYYYYDGQTPENTKISERAHALHVNKQNWKRINKHLDRKKDIQENMDKEITKWKNLKEASSNMTKNWDNSIANIRIKQEEERIRRTKEAQEKELQNFYKLRKEQEQLRQEYLNKVKKERMMYKNYPKNLKMALLHSDVLKERERQIELNKILKQKDKDDELALAKVFKENAKKEILENAEKTYKNREKKMKNGKANLKLCIEQEKQRGGEKLARIQEEAKDNIVALKELNMIKELDEKLKIEKTQALAKERKKHLKEVEEAKKKKKIENAELDEVLRIYNNAKHELECLRKVKENELQALFRLRNKKATENMLELRKKEEEKLQKIIDAFEKADRQDRIAEFKAEKEKRLKEERVQYEKDFFKERDIKIQEEKDWKNWLLINRFKVDEVTKKVEKEWANKGKERAQEYKRELLEQMDEVKKDIKLKEQQEYNVLIDYAEDDKEFFEYADEIMGIAKKENLTTVPIEKVILEYKQVNKLNDDKFNDGPTKQLIMKANENNGNKKKCRCSQKLKKK